MIYSDEHIVWGDSASRAMPPRTKHDAPDTGIVSVRLGSREARP